MNFKKLQKIIKRHPFLYQTRFRLLSKNSNLEEIKQLSYNQLNAKEAIPGYFYEINERIFRKPRPVSDFETVKQLSLWLKTHIIGGPGLSDPSAKALHTMLSGKGGVCSDIAQVFNNFCVINDIQVREWGTTSAPFNRDFGGHSFNEVYCRELDKWVLLDVSYGIMFYHQEQPLSVIELYQLFRKGNEVAYVSFLDIENAHEVSVNRNYLNPNTVPFLICNYSNKTYDTYLKRARPYVPVFLIHFGVYVLGRSYHYKFPLDDYKKIFS